MRQYSRGNLATRNPWVSLPVKAEQKRLRRQTMFGHQRLSETLDTVLYVPQGYLKFYVPRPLFYHKGLGGPGSWGSPGKNSVYGLRGGEPTTSQKCSSAPGAPTFVAHNDVHRRSKRSFKA